MEIAVLIKQVPDTDEVKLDPETGTMIREGVGAIANPLDLNALTAALDLRRQAGGRVTAISMGPEQALDALREALALGADRAILICDRAFAGSDTWATARVLAQAVRKTGPYDLVLAGEKATDGETGQVGPEVATLLDLPFATGVAQLEFDAEAGAVEVGKPIEEGTLRLRLPLPCLLSVVHALNEPSMPTLEGKRTARRAAVERLTCADLGLAPETVGLAGSPTRVVKIYRPVVQRQTELFSGQSIERGIDRLVEVLREKGLLNPALGQKGTQKGAEDGGKAAGGETDETKGAEAAESFGAQVAGEAPQAEEFPEGGVLVLAEMREGRIHEATRELTFKARELADDLNAPVFVLILCDALRDDPRTLWAFGADCVLTAEEPAFAKLDAVGASRVVEWVARRMRPQIVLAPATTFGRAAMPAAAARLATGLTADCTGLEIERETGLLLQTRPAIGGNIMATIKTPNHRPQMATVRPRTFRVGSPDFSRKGSLLRLDLPEGLSDSPVRLLAFERATAEDDVNLQDRPVVVSGGKGLKKAENFALLRELAELLGGAVGASRQAVEAHWIGYPHQVGLSGKVVTPRVYFAIGISGAVQHLAGMQTSECIVAINRDPEAGIFRVADLGFCGDLFDIVPRIIERLRAERGDETPRERIQVARAGTSEKGQELEAATLASIEASAFAPVTGQTVKELAALLGTRNVSTDPEKLAAYSRDEVPPEAYGGERIAQVLVFPENTQQVASVLRYANERHIAVTPRGAGTGLSGGAVPACGGILMAFDRMNRIIEIDEENLTATVEPGVVTAEITKAAAERGLLYAGDPCSGDASFIGGNVAENAGGNKVVKYGATGAQVLGLEVVLADGSVTRFGGKRRKDVTGYDFVHLLVGSEGTLGVVTEITLRLLPLPRFVTDLLVPFSTTEAAVAFAPKIQIEGRTVPASIEFMDSTALSLTERYLNCTLPYDDAAAHLIVQLEGNDREVLADETERMGDLCFAHGALEVFVADNRTARDKLWKARKAIAEAVMALAPHYAKEDLVVPTNRVPELIEAVKAACAKHRLEVAVFGHIGDGNMHVNLMRTEEAAGDWEEAFHDARMELYTATAALGGTLSGEHGIGLKRREYLRLFLDEAQIELIRRVKRAFDPNGILNPCKIIPD